MIVHVRNFGKIESADIELSSLTIFVGDNNSGKSYLMQLIYGLIEFFLEQNSEKFINDFQHKTIDNGFIEIKADNVDFYDAFQNTLNTLLKENKNTIIEKTFHTRSLSIDSLTVEFNKILDDFSLIIQDDDDNNENDPFSGVKGKQRAIIKKNDDIVHQMRFIGFNSEDLYSKAISLLFSTILFDQFNLSFNVDYSSNNQLLYLPAARSGLMLLYTNFFANSNEEAKSKNKGIIYEVNDNKITENEFGLTEPVYKFLTFLLKHKTSEMISDEKKSIISFIDKNIINGSMKKTGNTMRYKPASSNKSLPIYLSSSLVSELTPIYQILSGIQQYSFIFYDEIETCQHPTKQLQLARLLVRMINAGYKMIVSTHSDTMAAAINNLATLSFKEQKNDLLDKIGYEEADMLRSADINAYQFVIGKNGKTKVIEVPSHFSIGGGFDFNLFNKANDKIYYDAVKIAEVN